MIEVPGYEVRPVGLARWRRGRRACGVHAGRPGRSSVGGGTAAAVRARPAGSGCRSGAGSCPAAVCDSARRRAWHFGAPVASAHRRCGRPWPEDPGAGAAVRAAKRGGRSRYRLGAAGDRDRLRCERRRGNRSDVASHEDSITPPGSPRDHRSTVVLCGRHDPQNYRRAQISGSGDSHDEPYLPVLHLGDVLRRQDRKRAQGPERTGSGRSIAVCRERSLNESLN